MSPRTAKTPASLTEFQAPPRNSAPGNVAPLAMPSPTQLRSSPKVLDQKAQDCALSPQSPTNSQTLPTMSWTPQLLMQESAPPGVAPAFPVARGPAADVLHLVFARPSFASGSTVPAAARCHSWLVSRRLPERAQACSAWNQVRQALGGTPATEAAERGAVQLPGLGKLEGKGGEHERDPDALPCVAPPANRPARVALPSC